MAETSGRGLFFKVGAFKFSDATMITVSDASWANDQKVAYSGWGVRIFPRKSQYAGFHGLGTQTSGMAPRAVHVIGYKSGINKRSCRNTTRVATRGMLYATEASDNLRAVISSLRGLFERGRHLAYGVAQQLPNLGLTDCQSLHDYLVNPVSSGCEDKRLEIDLDGATRGSMGEW